MATRAWPAWLLCAVVLAAAQPGIGAAGPDLPTVRQRCLLPVPDLERVCAYGVVVLGSSEEHVFDVGRGACLPAVTGIRVRVDFVPPTEEAAVVVRTAKHVAGELAASATGGVVEVAFQVYETCALVTATVTSRTLVTYQVDVTCSSPCVH